MKKILFLLFVSLIFAGQIAAQDDDYTKTSQLKHEIGINATAFVKQILSFGDTATASNNSPYLITYKMITNSSIALRFGFGGRYNRQKESFEGFEDSAVLTNSAFDVRIGAEWQKSIAKRWKTSIGLDFITNSILEKRVIDTGFDVVTFEEKSFSLGGGPVLGIYFNINDKISLYTEGAAYFTSGESASTQDFKNFPEFNLEEDNITETDFSLYIPTTLYFIFTF